MPVSKKVMNGSMSPEIAPNRAPQTIPQIKTGMCIGNSTEPALGIGINLTTCGNSKPIAIQSPVKTSFFVEDLVIFIPPLNQYLGQWFGFIVALILLRFGTRDLSPCPNE